MDKKRLIGFLIMSVILLGIAFLVPYTLSLLKGEIFNPEIQEQTKFYNDSMSIGFIIITLGIMISIFITKGDEKYGSGMGFYGIGEKPSFKFFKRFTPIQLTLLSMIIFSTAFFFATTMNTQSLTGLKVLPQQFNVVDSILFSSALIPIAENLVAGAVIVIFLVLLRIGARKINMKSETFIILSIFLIFFILGAFGVAWHSTVYQDSELSKLVVFFFWGVGGVITLATGFFVIFAVMHLNNNLFIDLQRFYSNETIMLIIGLVLVILITIYILAYKNRIFGRRNE